MTTKKFIKKLHLYLALVLCLPLVLQGLSGSILVIDEFFSHSAKISPISKNYNIETIINVAQKQVPEGFIANVIKFDEVFTIRFSKKIAEKNSILEVKIDPNTLEVLQIEDLQKTPLNFIKKFHTNLLIQGDIGRNIIGVYGLVMLFMAISGLILWWPKKGNLKRAITFKFESSGKKFHRDLHGAVGFWASIFILISSFAGVYLAFPQGTGKFITTFFAAENLIPANKVTVDSVKGRYLTIDEAFKLAREEFPDNRVISLVIPNKAIQPYRINFAPNDYEYGQPAIMVFIDPWKGKIIEKRDPTISLAGDKIMAWQHALHTGTGLGLTWQIIIFFLGFLPLLFSVTGIWLWLIKRQSKKMEK